MVASDGYTACLDRLYRLRRFGIKLGLEVISGLLAHLDNPQQRYHCIHVAATDPLPLVPATWMQW